MAQLSFWPVSMPMRRQRGGPGGKPLHEPIVRPSHRLGRQGSLTADSPARPATGRRQGGLGSYPADGQFFIRLFGRLAILGP